MVNIYLKVGIKKFSSLVECKAKIHGQIIDKITVDTRAKHVDK